MRFLRFILLLLLMTGNVINLIQILGILLVVVLAKDFVKSENQREEIEQADDKEEQVQYLRYVV